jgi:acetylornithine/succinyldiaminopimelate/putrescine aminotransferase
LRVRDEANLDQHAASVSAALFDGLKRLAESCPHVYDAPRGVGLLAGLPVRRPFDAAAIVDLLREQASILVNKAGNNTIRMTPPLIVTHAQVERLLGALTQAANHIGAAA